MYKMSFCNRLAVLSSLCLIVTSCTGSNTLLGQNKEHTHPTTSLQASNPDQIDLTIQPALLGKHLVQLQTISLNKNVNQPNSTDFTVQAKVQLPKPVVPIIECVRHNADGSFTAFFGYHNENTNPVTIPIGVNNTFGVKTEDLGQPSSFQPGRTSLYPNTAFAIDFTQSNLVWHLNGSTVTATKNPNQTCPDRTGSGSNPNTIDINPAHLQKLDKLYPNVPGNKDVPIPETQQSEFQINNSISDRVSPGLVKIELAAPVDQHLQEILSKYKAHVVYSPKEDFYWIQADMTTIGVQHLEKNLRILNRSVEPEFYVNKVAFGNLEAAKTFALVAELLVDERIKGAAFDHQYPNANATVKTVEHPNPPADLGGNLDAHNSWWLNENSTKTVDAWHYNMGYIASEKRPVKIAVMDGGFSSLERTILRPNYEIFGWGVLWNEGYVVTGGALLASWYDKVEIDGVDTPLYDVEDKTISCLSLTRSAEIVRQCTETSDPFLASSRLFNKPDPHGTSVISTIIAEVNNKKGIAGVAPQAQVIPIKVGNGEGFNDIYIEMAISQLYKEIVSNGLKVDIVNMSFGLSDQGYAKTWTERFSSSANYSILKQQIEDLSRNYKVTFVKSAGNSAYDVERDSFATPHISDIIFVGAIEDRNRNVADAPNDLFRAIYNAGGNPKNTTDWGSNYGGKITIWAPGDDMAAVGLQAGLAHTDEPQPWGGTSAAAPVVSGAIALMKAANPNLTSSQIISLLQGSSLRKPFYRDSLVKSFPFFNNSDLSLVNSECGQYVNCGALKSVDLLLDILDTKEAVNAAGASLATNIQGKLISRIVGTKKHMFLESSSGTYSLYWGDFQDSFMLDNKYGEIGNTGEFVPVSGWLNNPNAVVTVQGQLNGSSLYFTQIQLGSNLSGGGGTGGGQCNPNERWYVRAYNVDDTATAYVNLNNILSVGYRRDSGFVPINNYLHNGSNQVRFTLFNNLGGYTWGFQVKKEIGSASEIVYDNKAGQAGVTGANNNDQSHPNQIVFDQTFSIAANICDNLTP